MLVCSTLCSHARSLRRYKRELHSIPQTRVVVSRVPAALRLRSRETTHMPCFSCLRCRPPRDGTRDRIRWWLTFLVIIVLVAILVAGIALAAILIPIARYPQLTAKVEDSRLNTFEFRNTRGDGATMVAAIFSYNISVALAIRNPKAVLKIRHTKPLVATFLFHDRRLNNVTVVDQGHMNQPEKTELHLLRVAGELPFIVFGVAAAEDLKKQQAAGRFKVEVRLSVYISVLRERKFSLSCPLRLQLAPPGPEVVLFHAVNCILDTQDKFYF